MKKVIFVLVAAMAAAVAHGQIISSRVTDSTTGEPVAGADVYINQSTIATTTDSEGRFSLDVKGLVLVPLIIDHDSYNSFSLRNPLASLPAQVALTPKTVFVRDLTYVPDLLPRSEKLQVLRDELLGETKAGMECTIMNESDITLFFEAQTNTLYAFCDSPVEIVNEHLGYRLFFTISDVRVVFRRYSLDRQYYVGANIAGTMRFVDLLPESDRLDGNRRKTYRASPTAFFRHLSGGSMQGSGFTISTTAGKVTPRDMFSITELPDGRLLGLLPERQRFVTGEDHQDILYTFLRVNYHGEDRSSVIFQKDSIVFDNSGYCTDPDACRITGALADKRLGDVMPLDYRAKK